MVTPKSSMKVISPAKPAARTRSNTIIIGPIKRTVPEALRKVAKRSYAELSESSDEDAESSGDAVCLVQDPASKKVSRYALDTW